MKKVCLFIGLIGFLVAITWWVQPWTLADSKDKNLKSQVLAVSEDDGSDMLSDQIRPDPELANNKSNKVSVAAMPVVEKEVPDSLKLSEEDRQMILNEHPKVLEIKIFEENEFLRKFKLITEKKALSSKSDLDELRGMLQDKVAIVAFETALASPMTQNHFYREQLERMYYIDFFKASLELDQNESIEQVRKSIQTIILADNLDPELPLKMRKSIAAEKVELIQLLVRYDQESIEILRGQVGTSRHKKLLNHYLSAQPVN